MGLAGVPFVLGAGRDAWFANPPRADPSSLRHATGAAEDAQVPRLPPRHVGGHDGGMTGAGWEGPRVLRRAMRGA